MLTVIKKIRILSINIFFFTKHQLIENPFNLFIDNPVKSVYLFRNCPTLSKANEYVFIDDNICTNTTSIDLSDFDSFCVLHD